MKSVLFSSIQNKFDKTYENLVKIIHIPTKVTETMISGLCFFSITYSKKENYKIFIGSTMAHLHISTKINFNTKRLTKT